MSSQDTGMVPTQRLDGSLNPQLLFQEETPSLQFGCSGPRTRVPDPGPKTRGLGGFIEDKPFFAPPLRRVAAEFRRAVYVQPVVERRPPPQSRNWGSRGGVESPSSGEDDEEEEQEEDEDVDEDGELEEMVGVHCSSGRGGGDKNNSSSGGSSSQNGEKNGNENSVNHGPFGLSGRQMLVKDEAIAHPGADSNRASTSENGQQGRAGHFPNLVTVAERVGDMYYSQLLQGQEGSGQGHRDVAGDNGCGFSGRKDGSTSSDPVESLRAIFSDPITGALMDDAVILSCGHSFGAGGMQHVIKMRACYTCSHPISEASVSPNLSLRAAVQAFRREEDLQPYRSSKRRMTFEQEKGNIGDSSVADTPRGRGVQFPFTVSDRVIIKGNKRTPQRFVGREAVVTTQCLNGWYVVKTLDNAESVKLQYRSLEKVSDNPSQKPMSDKMAPNWL